MLVFIIIIVILFMLGMAIYSAPTFPEDKRDWFWKWCMKMHQLIIDIWVKISRWLSSIYVKLKIKVINLWLRLICFGKDSLISTLLKSNYFKDDIFRYKYTNELESEPNYEVVKEIPDQWEQILLQFIDRPYRSRSDSKSWLLRQLAKVLQFRALYPKAYREFNSNRIIISEIIESNIKNTYLLGLYDFWSIYDNRDQKYHLIIVLNRPGIIIGKGGQVIDKIKSDIQTKTGNNWSIDLFEIIDRDNLSEGLWELSLIRDNW